MMNLLLLASFTEGLAVPALVISQFSSDIDWSKKLGGPTWDFSRSWASNLTAAGTILSYTVLLSWMAPTATFPKQDYLTVGAIAAGLSVLAPLAFNVMSRIFQACDVPSASSSAFLISAGITIWGLTLQLFLGARLVWELHSKGTLNLPLAVALVAFLLLLSVLVALYAILTAKDTLAKVAPAPADKAQLPGLQSQASTPTTWSLL
jgi:hypothetical protein